MQLNPRGGDRVPTFNWVFKISNSVRRIQTAGSLQKKWKQFVSRRISPNHSGKVVIRNLHIFCCFDCLWLYDCIYTITSGKINFLHYPSLYPNTYNKPINDVTLLFKKSKHQNFLLRPLVLCFSLHMQIISPV